MTCLLKLAFIYLCATQLFCTTIDAQKTGTCRYYNDPHLIPFPTSPGASQSQYLCRNNVTETLVKNKFVELIVTPDPAGEYPIVAYTLIFFATGIFSYPCVITNSIANPSISLTCPLNTPASSIMSVSGQYHTHLTENIRFDITKRRSHFNIMITQSFDLIAKSRGVCVKWNCEFENVVGKRNKRQAQEEDLNHQICDLFIKAGQRNALGEVNQGYVESLRTACVYDMKTTSDQSYGEGIVTLILRDSVKQYRNDENFKEYLQKADQIGEEAIKEVHEEINKLVLKA